MKINYNKSGAGKKTNTGFTLIEILVVGAILGILTATTIAGIRIQRTNNEVANQAQRIAAFLEKARAYAAHPRIQDNRPLYYMVEFDPNRSNIRLVYFRDTLNNDQITDDIVDKNSRPPLEELNLASGNESDDLNIEIDTLNNFFNIDHITNPNATNERIIGCNTSPIIGGLETNIYAFGFKVGTPNKILARCGRFTSGIMVGGTREPVLTFATAYLPLQFINSDIQSAFNQTVFIRINNYGENIEVCQTRGTDYANPTKCY